jgi:hypothetical protein
MMSSGNGSRKLAGTGNSPLSAGLAARLCLLHGQQTDGRLAAAGDHDLLARERALDQP